MRLVVNQFGGYLALDIKIWTDEVILAKLPPMDSVVDQPANLMIVRENGERSPFYPVEFRATRDIQAVVGKFLSQVTTSQRTDYDVFDAGDLYCNITDPATGNGTYGVRVSFGAYHATEYDINAHYKGHDVWTLNLINGWVTSSWSIGRTSDSSSGEFSVANGIVLGSPTISLDVDWDISGYTEILGYSTYILATGPKGTPYATDLLPGLTITNPSVDLGLPCTAH